MAAGLIQRAGSCSTPEAPISARRSPRHREGIGEGQAYNRSVSPVKSQRRHCGGHRLSVIRTLKGVLSTPPKKADTMSVQAVATNSYNWDCKINL